MSAVRRLSRFALLLVCVASSFHALLAHVPFTAIHFLSFRHFGWLASFVAFHEAIVLCALAAVAGTLAGDLRSPSSRFAAALGLGFAVATALALSVAAPLRDLAAGGAGPWLPLFWLLPPVWISLADFAAGAREGAPAVEARTDAARLVEAAMIAAIVVGAAAFARGALLQGETALDAPGLRAIAGAAGIELLVVTLASLAAAAVVELVRILDRSPRFELLVACFLLGAALEHATRAGVLASISYLGGPARLYAASLAAAIVAVLAGSAVRERRDARGFAALLETIAPSASAPWIVVWLVGLGALAHALLAAIAPVDWNGLVQRGVAFLAWMFATAAVHRALPARSTPRRAWRYATALVPLPLYLLAGGADANAILARRAEADPVLALAGSLLRAPEDGADFYAFLQRRTNLPRSTPARPFDVRFVDRFAEGGNRRPHVFLVVVDSLRQDYLAPYDSRVDFTPEISRFAAESTVFRSAFTRYGATGLAEPSIWVGGMMLHLQYVQPFAPMNALAKLLEHEDYRVLVSLDTILRVILPPTLEVVDVDSTRSEGSFNVCTSLEEIAARVARDADDPRPIFAYTQPQDLHVSVRNREGDKPIDDRAVPTGFYAPYASRVRRLDACFGKFLDGLRARGLYDDSIVILTSDHGDSLGEEGRWGHAYTIVPEVLRIPLIVHLPKAEAATFTADPGGLATTADLTPTLYRLLGHGPIRSDPLLGRPLFDAASDAPAPRPDAVLVASSYGPVYGLLSGDASELYVADAVGFSDTRYDLSRTYAGERLPIPPELRDLRRTRIRDEIEAIGRAYGLGEGTPGAGAESSSSNRRASS